MTKNAEPQHQEVMTTNGRSTEHGSLPKPTVPYVDVITSRVKEIAKLKGLQSRRSQLTILRRIEEIKHSCGYTPTIEASVKLNTTRKREANG